MQFYLGCGKWKTVIFFWEFLKAWRKKKIYKKACIKNKLIEFIFQRRYTIGDNIPLISTLPHNRMSSDQILPCTGSWCHTFAQGGSACRCSRLSGCNQMTTPTGSYCTKWNVMKCMSKCKNWKQWLSASTSLPSNTNAPMWSPSIEIHGKFLLGRLLLSIYCWCFFIWKRIDVFEKWLFFHKTTISFISLIFYNA